MKHIARILLLVLIFVAAYLALRPQYNMAHWTPNQTLRNLGLSYQSILAYEHNLHWFLHLFVGLMATILLYLSKFYFPEDSKSRIVTGFLLVATMAVLAEWLQSGLERDVEIADLVFGLAGATIASGILAIVVRKRSDPG